MNDTGVQAGPEVNRPEVVADVRAAFERYEAALNANDVDDLDELFWRSELTLRYGLGENLYGHKAIAAFRSARSASGISRRIFETRITTFGDAFAVANTEFERLGAGVVGRQSQTWVRMAEGWRIVAAHVSFFDPDGDLRGR